MSEIESSYRVTGDELRKFIERIERLDAEKKDLIAVSYTHLTLPTIYSV